MPASGYFLVRVQELQRPEVIHSVKVRWYSSIKDLKDQLHLITHEPPSAQHIFHPSNPTEFRNSSTLQSIGIDHDGFTLKVAFDDYVRAPFYLEPLKKELIDEPTGTMLGEVQQGLKRDKAPKVTDELDGSGGVYFLRSQKGFYAAVFKPHDEEQGMPNNPKGYDGAGQTGLRDHFRPGQGCLREVAAYIMDHDNFCGVPPTALIHCQHSSFSYPTTSGKRKLFPKLGSLQQFIRASECFDDLGPGQFSDFEIQKIALLDLRLLNCDRNAANMLVRYKRSISGGSSSSEGNGVGSSSVDASSPSDSGDRDGASWIDRRSPVSGQDMYELVPIDHGYCMPSKLRIDEFDLAWMTLPQVKREVHPTIKEYVVSLDFEAMLYNVLEQISLPGNSIFLLALAHLLVVQGIASGLTLYEIATLVARLDDEQASKLEQAIEEAEENAFRAIEMKSHRFPSNPSLLTAGHTPHSHTKSSVPLSPLHYRNNRPGSSGSPPKDMELVSPSTAGSAHTIHASISMTDLLQEESKNSNTTLDPVACEKIRNNLAIGTDGVWDMKSIAACASPATSVLKSISPYVASPQLIPKNSPDIIALPKSGDRAQVSVATTAAFSLNMSTQINGIQKPSPLELGSSFLSHLILAACEDDCEVAIGSPTRASPHDAGADTVTIPPKLARSPLSKKDVDFQPPFGGYLAPIDEERRMRGGSTGSTCSSTENGGVEASPLPVIQTRDSMLSTSLDKSDINSFVNRRAVECDPLGPSLSRMPRYDDSGSNDVVYRSVQLNSSLPFPPSKDSLLTSPKFISALSNMHEGQSMDGNMKGNDCMSTLPLQGTELSRMRSVGPPPSAARMADEQNNMRSTSKDSFGEQGSGSGSRSGSTFEGIGSGWEIDIEEEGKETHSEASVSKDPSGNVSALSVKFSPAENERSHVIEKARKYEKLDSAREAQPDAYAAGNTSFCDLYSPLSRILAVPSDPNLSTSLLETCMTAGENAVEPIEQPSLRKLPIPDEVRGGGKETMTTETAVSAAPPTAPAQALQPNAESTDKTPLRKRKHGSFASDSEEPVVEGDVSRPYSTPSPVKRADAVDAQLGPRSATQASETKKTWIKPDLSAEKKSIEQDPDLYNAPGMTRVASFSGFESAPIYDFHAEGRFGSLRQEKRKTIMKTPEFNKFRLHFAHEAVLSIINRLLKQKELRKSDVVA